VEHHKAKHQTLRTGSEEAVSRHSFHRCIASRLTRGADQGRSWRALKKKEGKYRRKVYDEVADVSRDLKRFTYGNAIMGIGMNAPFSAKWLGRGVLVGCN